MGEVQLLKITPRIIEFIFQRFGLLVALLSLCPFVGAAPLGSSSRESILKGHPPVVLESLLVGLPQEKAIQSLQKVVLETPPLARGSQPAAGRLLAVHQQSLQQLKVLGPAQVPEWALKEGELWFQLWERITYEEGRFQSLVEVLRLRENLWKTLQEKALELSELKSATEPDQRAFLKWIESRNPIFPVDRVFLLEAKARWPQSQMKSAERITQMLQKRPDMPISAAVRSLKIRSTPEIVNLEREWSETQVAQMRADLEAHQRLLLSVAVRLFQLKNGKKPSENLSELEKQAWVSLIPVRPSVGKPWSLADLSL